MQSIPMEFVSIVAAFGVAGAAATILMLRRLTKTAALPETERQPTLGCMWTPVDGNPVFARLSLQSAPVGRLPVVLVHGLVISSRYMVPLAAELAAEFPVYAPDLPGYGESRRQGRTLDVPELADALYRWMKTIGMSRAIFIGNSFGCQVIAALAQRHPAAVDRAVLQGPTVDPAARAFVKQAWRLVVNARHERHAGLGRRSRTDYAKAGVRRAIGTVRLMLSDHIEDRLPHILQPTLVVRGSLDPVVPQAWAERATRLLPHGQLVVVPGRSHTLNFTDPRGFVAAIRPFLLSGHLDS